MRQTCHYSRAVCETRPNRWGYKFYNFLMSATKMRAIFIFRENAFGSFFIRSVTFLVRMEIKIHATQRLLDAGYNMLLLCWDLVWRWNICCCFLAGRDKFMFWLKSAKWWTKRCLVQKIASPTQHCCKISFRIMLFYFGNELSSLCASFGAISRQETKYLLLVVYTFRR